MTESEFVTRDKTETQSYGEKLGKLAPEGTVILMYGDLGAGKTTFTQGLARGLEISRRINSPTFNILKIYNGRLPLYHIDAYRLEGLRQDLGFEEYLEDPDGVVIVEWPMYIDYLLPANRISITIRIGEEEERIFSVKAEGEKEEELVKEWLR